MQNTFIKVSKNIRNFEYDPGKGKFRNWLCLIAKQQAANLFRKSEPKKDVVGIHFTQVTTICCGRSFLAPIGAALCQPRVERQERSDGRATLGGGYLGDGNPNGVALREPLQRPF